MVWTRNPCRYNYLYPIMCFPFSLECQYSQIHHYNAIFGIYYSLLCCKQELEGSCFSWQYFSICLGYLMFNSRMISIYDLGKKKLVWPILRYNSRFCLEGWRETMGTSFKMASLCAKIQTWDLLDIEQETQPNTSV